MMAGGRVQVGHSSGPRVGRVTASIQRGAETTFSTIPLPGTSYSLPAALHALPTAIPSPLTVLHSLPAASHALLNASYWLLAALHSLLAALHVLQTVAVSLPPIRKTLKSAFGIAGPSLF